MTPRISRSLLAVALLGLAVFGLWELRANRELRGRMAQLTRRNAELQRDVAQAAKRAADLEQRAVALDTQLGSAKSRTTATESRHVQLNRELTVAQSLLTEREQREVALMAELATLREKVAGAKESVQPAAAEVVDVSAYERRIIALEQQLTELLTRALAETMPELLARPAPNPPPPQVVRVGPRDSFVVIDYGRQQGARPGDILRLQRGTSEVARVQISDVRPRFSLAQVLPASLKGQLQSGDFVVLEN